MSAPRTFFHPSGPVLRGLAAAGLCAAAQVAQAVPADAQIDLKVLVLASQQAGNSPELQATQTILDRLGVPYTIYSYDTNNPTLPALESGDHAKYQGIIMPISDARYMNPFSGGALATTLARYQFKYNVRLASVYTWPGDTGCMQYVGYRDTTASPLNTTLTATGKTLFPYMNAGASTANPLTVQNAWTYFMSPASPLPAGTTTTTQIQGTASTGVTYSVASTCLFGNTTPLTGDSTSREIMAVSFDNNPFLMHSMTLSYGIVNWVTRGLFVGVRHVYMDPQVDDNGIPDEIFPYAVSDYTGEWYDVRNGNCQPNNPCVYTSTTPPGQCPLGSPVGSVNPNTGTTACEYRTVGADFDNLMNWQDTVNSNTANAGALKFTLAFNGSGYGTAYGGLGNYPTTGTDTLSTETNANEYDFKWITHTYDHILLDPPFTTTAAQVTTELQNNDNVAQTFGFENYNTSVIVTPEISGLYNATTLGALQSFGITVLVSDSSKPTPPVGTPGCPINNNGVAWPLPPFNAGKFNCVNQNIFEIPRYATALFYNVSQPSEWVAEYNYFYGANGIDPTRWGVDQTYAQVLDHVSDTLVSYLLTYDMRPLMFHQPNFRMYSGTSTLLGDLLTAVMTKYNKYYKGLPLRSPYLSDAGVLGKQRLVFDTSSVAATLVPGKSITVSASRSDGQSVVVPVTGVTFGTVHETYGGQVNSTVTLLPATAYTTQITPAPAWQ
ncbi:Agd3-related carbohydrate deacetylase [Burkholderia sp. MR1-5-21]